jgi:hypothetical protein
MGLALLHVRRCSPCSAGFTLPSFPYKGSAVDLGRAQTQEDSMLLPDRDESFRPWASQLSLKLAGLAIYILGMQSPDWVEKGMVVRTKKSHLRPRPPPPLSSSA